jgi:hypothetical protein
VPANAKTKLGENRTKWKEDRLLISTEKILQNTTIRRQHSKSKR